MIFDYPNILFGFVVFVPLIIYDIADSRKSAAGSKRLTGDLLKKSRACAVFFRLFLAFSIIALAGPRWGTGYAPAEYYRSLDVVFAIDISRSMDIRDASAAQSNSQDNRQNISMSRLERGLSAARETIASVPGARYAAAVGRSRGYLAIPLTYDNEAALIFLESLDGSSMTGRSTNLESLVEAACEAFQNTSAARKVIVLISDGESHSGVFRNIVNHCAREGIIINTVAVGSDEGRQISSQTDVPQSPPVISARDSVVMRSAAERTGGIYIDGGREDAVIVLSSHLLSLEKETEAVNRKTETKQRRTLFIILALISFSASKFVTRKFNRTSRLKNRTQHIFTLVLLLTSCSEGKLLLMEANYLHSLNRFEEAIVPFMKALDHEDAAPYAEYGLGLTHYLLDHEDAALSRYNDSQKKLEAFPENEHSELRYRNFYNSGIIFFEKEDFRSAANAFREALRANPGKIDAKRNLELSLLSISMEQAEPNRTDSRQEQKEILFDYLRDEEQKLWKSREWTAEEEYAGSDY